MDYKGGKFKKLGGQGVDGNDLLGFSKEDPLSFPIMKGITH